jgi:hypothetical protein
MGAIKMQVVIGIVLGLTLFSLYSLFNSYMETESDIDIDGNKKYMLTFHQETYGQSVSKFRILKSNSPLTYRETMVNLASKDKMTIDILTRIIKSHNSRAVFWECIPFTAATFESALFEFVIISSSRLEGIQTDIHPFIDHFKKLTGMEVSDSFAVTFQNIGGDATLVVPTPVTAHDFAHPPPYMAHLAVFVRGANEKQIEHYFRAVGSAVIDVVERAKMSSDLTKRFWLSTSGLGVSWLHTRIDTFPKYYNWAEYK